MLRPGLVALHQPGAPGDRRHQPGTQRALPVQRCDLGQVFAKRFGDAHLSRGAARPDGHRGGHLGGRRIPGVERPQRAVVVVFVDAAPSQLGDRGQPPGTGDRLLPHTVLDRGNKLLITGRRKLGIEHTFDTATAHPR